MRDGDAPGTSQFANADQYLKSQVYQRSAHWTDNRPRDQAAGYRTHQDEGLRS